MRVGLPEKPLPHSDPSASLHSRMVQNDKISKQKTAYEISCCLVGSEMCIRDSSMTTLPSDPWMEVAVDLAGPFPSGEYLLVVIDEYSRFPEVGVISSTSAKTVIPHLDMIFSRMVSLM